jgi:hypothetical protein
MAHRTIFPALLFFCFLIFTEGCANWRVPILPPKNTINLPNSQIIVYGIEKEDPTFEYLSEALSKLPERARNSITFFVVHKDNSRKHFDDEPAHCHSHSNKICILKSNFYSYVDTLECIWHETAHAYFHTLPNSATQEWKEISGKVYGRPYDSWLDFFKNGPTKGTLTLYSLTEYGEDIAEFTKAVYAYVYLYKKHGFFGTNYFRGDLKKDPRYLRKLQFLLKWGFITQEDYHIIEPLLKPA